MTLRELIEQLQSLPEEWMDKQVWSQSETAYNQPDKPTLVKAHRGEDYVLLGPRP